jgi:hypothetical protein
MVPPPSLLHESNVAPQYPIRKHELQTASIATLQSPPAHGLSIVALAGAGREAAAPSAMTVAAAKRSRRVLVMKFLQTREKDHVVTVATEFNSLKGRARSNMRRP